MGKYSYNNNTEAISCRLAPGLKDRIDFDCQQRMGWTRNKFINYACMVALDIRHEVQCGNVKLDELPEALQKAWYLFCS